MQGFIGEVTAISGFLLGGVKVHRSAPFATRVEAETWIAAIQEGNRQAFRECSAGRVLVKMVSAKAIAR